MIKSYIEVGKKYQFLLGQLVSRDFKTRYKRSVLGVLWSMLNPLLTMCVQYIVFANLFRWDVDNYAVYLLIGTVTFNFFSEATQGALTAITGSSSLITKVYVPTNPGIPSGTAPSIPLQSATKALPFTICPLSIPQLQTVIWLTLCPPLLRKWVTTSSKALPSPRTPSTASTDLRPCPPKTA